MMKGVQEIFPYDIWVELKKQINENYFKDIHVVSNEFKKQSFCVVSTDCSCDWRNETSIACFLRYDNSQKNCSEKIEGEEAARKWIKITPRPWFTLALE